MVPTASPHFSGPHVLPGVTPPHMRRVVPDPSSLRGMPAPTALSSLSRHRLQGVQSLRPARQVFPLWARPTSRRNAVPVMQPMPYTLCTAPLTAIQGLRPPRTGPHTPARIPPGSEQSQQAAKAGGPTFIGWTPPARRVNLGWYRERLPSGSLKSAFSEQKKLLPCGRWCAGPKKLPVMPSHCMFWAAYSSTATSPARHPRR